MPSGCHECIHVSRLCGASIYYICNYTFKSVLPLSILLQQCWMRKPIFLILGQFPEPAASPRTCTISAHRTISWFLEQIGNRITDSVSNSVPSSSCIRLQKQNRTIDHWCLSTPYTKETLSTPIHSCSSRAISCWQTRQSVLGRWVVDINAHDIHWVSQSDTWDRCMFSARLVQHLLIHLPSKLICGRVQFHEVSCNSRQQTDTKTDCRHYGNKTEMAKYRR